jgi:predicted metalloprotease with PDZ domain
MSVAFTYGWNPRWSLTLRRIAAAALVASGLVAGDRALAQNAPSPALKAIEQRNAARGALGVLMSDNARGGELITRVLPGSPAARIGLRAGDRILAVGGKEVSTYLEVVNLVATYKPNSQIQLRIDRNGWTNTLAVSLGNAGAVFTDGASQARTTTPPSRTVTVPQGSLIAPPYLQDLTPADIDDQHGYGG